MKRLVLLFILTFTFNAVSEVINFPFKGSSFNNAELKRNFATEDFEWLDEVAQDLRTTKARRYPEEWFLATFYYELGIAEKADEYTASKYKQRLDKWAKNSPNSITWRVLTIDYHITRGWDARGSGWASSVTPKGWEVLEQELSQAWALIKDSLENSEPDPHFYGLTFTTLMGHNLTDTRYPQLHFNQSQIQEFNELKSRDIGDYFFKKAVALETGYFEIYKNLLMAKMPRWGGRPGEVEAFMLEAHEIGNDAWDRGLYARLHHNIAKWLGLSYMKVHQTLDSAELIASYETLMKVPGFFDHWKDITIQVACTYEDRETARRLFKVKNGDQPFKGWNSVQQYTFWRKWAMGDDPYPVNEELFFAVIESNTWRVKDLIGPDTDVNGTNGEGRSLLFFALRYEQIENGDTLINHGAKIDDDDLHTMSVGMRTGNPIKLLLKHGLDPNHIGKDGMPLIHRAAQFGSPNGFKNVVNGGADLNTIWDENGNTALHLIAAGHRNAMLDFLANKSPDTTIKNKAGLTALDVARQAMKSTRNQNEKNKFGNSVRKLEAF